MGCYSDEPTYFLNLHTLGTVQLERMQLEKFRLALHLTSSVASHGCVVEDVARLARLVDKPTGNVNLTSSWNSNNKIVLKILRLPESVEKLLR